jgi:hypothetical protein
MKENYRKNKMQNFYFIENSAVLAFASLTGTVGDHQPPDQ